MINKVVHGIYKLCLSPSLSIYTLHWPARLCGQQTMSPGRVIPGLAGSCCSLYSSGETGRNICRALAKVSLSDLTQSSELCSLVSQSSVDALLHCRLRFRQKCYVWAWLVNHKASVIFHSLVYNTWQRKVAGVCSFLIPLCRVDNFLVSWVTSRISITFLPAIRSSGCLFKV